MSYFLETEGQNNLGYLTNFIGNEVFYNTFFDGKFDRLQRITTVTSFKLIYIVFFLLLLILPVISWNHCIGLALKLPIRNLCILQHNKIKKKEQKHFYTPPKAYTHIL